VSCSDAKIRHVLTAVRAALLGYEPKFQAGGVLAVEEIAYRLQLEEPTDEEIGIARLAQKMDAAMQELVEKGEYVISGQDEFGENLYQPKGLSGEEI